jgi:hypothetical protein
MIACVHGEDPLRAILIGAHVAGRRMRHPSR